MRRSILLLSLLVPSAVSLHAQAPTQKALHWVKTTFYHARPGSLEPDTSKIPEIYLHPNTLVEYREDGAVRSSMDYKRGTDDANGLTLHRYWDGPRLKKEVQENDGCEVVYTTTYAYDAAGHEIKRETTRGPGDKFGVISNESTESIWTDGKPTKEVRKDSKGEVQAGTSHTCDATGRMTRKDFHPISRYSAETFRYDSKGNVLTDTWLDKEGKPGRVTTNE